jgi:hypothetical protein
MPDKRHSKSTVEGIVARGGGSTGLAMGIYSQGSQIISPFLQAQTLREDSEADTSTPAWLTGGPIVATGCWDDFPQPALQLNISVVASRLLLIWRIFQ